MEILSKTGPEAERQKTRLDKWLKSVHEWHDHFIWSPNEKPAWTAPQKPLNQSRVALVTTAGVHLKTQTPFDVKSEYGDWSYRKIPANSDPANLMISDTHYDHSEPDQDINCILPISHLRSLSEAGVIASAAENAYGFMGFVPNPDKLISETAPEVANALLEDKVDIVFMTPG